MTGHCRRLVKGGGDMGDARQHDEALKITSARSPIACNCISSAFTPRRAADSDTPQPRKTGYLSGVAGAPSTASADPRPLPGAPDHAVPTGLTFGKHYSRQDSHEARPTATELGIPEGKTDAGTRSIARAQLFHDKIPLWLPRLTTKCRSEGSSQSPFV